MSAKAELKRDVDKAADIVRDAGGKIIGRTRLQKIAYFLELAGVGDGFAFRYRHFGPYSEELASASRHAALLDLIDEVEQLTQWGGVYSVYTSLAQKELTSSSSARRELASKAAEADSVVLELAATAAFLHSQGEADAWAETARRKPEKATHERLNEAKALYEGLRAIETDRPLPRISG